eukprot:5588176-Pyramimonas_sp.AAC.1
MAHVTEDTQGDVAAPLKAQGTPAPGSRRARLHFCARGPGLGGIYRAKRLLIGRRGNVAQSDPEAEGGAGEDGGDGRNGRANRKLNAAVDP